jgi:hypothetical protein
VSKHSDADFDQDQTQSKFLPRVQLMTGRSAKCERGEFPINHYALVVTGGKFLDLGETFDCLVLAWRYKALEIAEEIITVYDRKDPEFTRIKDAADAKEDNFMWGYEFLLWLGQEKRFATYFAGSISARNESKNIKSQMNGAATFRSEFIEGKKHSWQNIQVVVCSTPMNMPGANAVAEQRDRFLNPAVEKKDKVEADGEAV